MRIAMIGQKGIPATYGGVERHVEASEIGPEPGLQPLFEGPTAPSGRGELDVDPFEGAIEVDVVGAGFGLVPQAELGLQLTVDAADRDGSHGGREVVFLPAGSTRR